MSIDNTKNIIDSRDIIARIEELTDERDAWIENDDGDEGEQDRTAADWREEFPDEANELRALAELAEEAEGYAPDWRYGEALIRDSYFIEFAQELAEDIGAIDKAASWPNTCIDWEQAARELQMDYTQVDFDGVAYWIR